MAKLLFLTLFAAIFSLQTALAEVKLPAIYSNNLILQQKSDVNVWGWAKPNASVSVKGSWDGKSYSTKADANGSWKTKVQTPAASFTPYTLTVSEENTITLQNVLIGEIWICSGQSNMEMPLKGFDDQPVNGSADAIATSQNPNIRLFTVQKASGTVPKPDCVGSWSEANPGTVADFSATAYFFGRSLFQNLNIPIGLIHSSWGGSLIEAWLATECVAEIKEPIKTPAAFYNAMISPLSGYSIKGFLWYQGEADVTRGYEYYRTYLEMLINSWRNDFKQGNLPFIYVQLHNVKKPCTQPCESDWAELRDAQAYALHLPQTGMAAAIDLGSEYESHPRKKQEIGNRLALTALKVAYGKEIIASGPTYKSSKKKDNGIILTFENVGAGLKTKDGSAPKEFSIATKDGNFVWAKAEIVCKNQIFVWHETILNPEYVRYAWADNPNKINTCNTIDLPMVPFRTDNRNINR